MYRKFFIALVFIVLNEEKLIGPLIYSSFRRVATSNLRRNSVSTKSSGQNHWNLAHIRSEYRFTPY